MADETRGIPSLPKAIGEAERFEQGIGQLKDRLRRLANRFRHALPEGVDENQKREVVNMKGSLEQPHLPRLEDTVARSHGVLKECHELLDNLEEHI